MKVFSEAGRARHLPLRWSSLADRFLARNVSLPASAIPLLRRLSQSRLNMVLAGLAAFLLLSLFAELVLISLPADQRAAPLRPLAASAAPRSLDLDRAVAGWASAALSRPVFNPDRRPFQAAVPQALPPSLPRLAGIMIAGPRKLAIFSGPDGDAITAAEGGQLGVFKIISIAADGVQVNGPAGVEQLQVDYRGDPAPRAASTGNSATAQSARAPKTYSWPFAMPAAAPPAAPPAAPQ